MNCKALPWWGFLVLFKFAGIKPGPITHHLLMLLPIPHPTVLSGGLVELRPLEKEHFGELEALSKDQRIWEFYALNGGDSNVLLPALEAGLDERERGVAYPFVIYHKADGKLIGSTRFIDIQPGHHKLEIGWTWLHPDYWATAVNFECKLLLLTFAFEALGAYRVQFKTDVLNMRSRKAIEKIGGKFEGILRNDMVRGNGTQRDSAYFSIVESEWPETKQRLQGLLANRLANKAV